MRFSFDRKYLVALGVALAAIVAIGSLGLQVTARLREALVQMSRGSQAQTALSDVHLALTDMASSASAYALTGDPALLEPYRAAVQQLGPRLEQAERLAEPGADLQALHAEATAQRELAATLVALAAQNPAAAAERARSRSNRASMDRLHTLLARLDARERARLAASQQAAQSVIRRNERLAALLGAACMLLLGGIYWVMRAELRTRQQAERAEHATHATLEARVTERTRALQQTAAALAHSEARLRMVFDTASDAILTVDADQTIVMANVAAASTFGIGLQQLVGMPLDRLIPARLRARHRHDVAQFGSAATARRTMGRQAEVSGLRADGTEFPAEAAISHATLDGHPLYTVVLRDISRRRQAEQALRDSEARLRHLLELLPDAVLTSTGGRIGYVNAEAQRLFGAGAEALIGRAPLELIHPPSQPLVRQRIADLTAGRSTVPPAELTIRRADGSTRTVECTATSMDENGQHSIVVVMRDMSELRRAEADLERSHQDLQRLVAAQDDVQENERRRIAVELHDDLQQTLAAIRMDITVAASRMEAGSRALPLLDSARELAGKAIESTRRIIGDLRPQILDDLGLGPALQQLATQFEHRTGITCSVEADEAALDGPLPPQAATGLYRIVQEALNNAAKHSSADLVAIHLSTRPDVVSLRIVDDGVGIPDPGQRRAGAVGLVGMQERVRLLGGRLALRRLQPRGTVVEVEVPLPTA